MAECKIKKLNKTIWIVIAVGLIVSISLVLLFSKDEPPPPRTLYEWARVLKKRGWSFESREIVHELDDMRVWHFKKTIGDLILMARINPRPRPGGLVLFENDSGIGWPVGGITLEVNGPSNHETDLESGGTECYEALMELLPNVKTAFAKAQNGAVPTGGTIGSGCYRLQGIAYSEDGWRVMICMYPAEKRMSQDGALLAVFLSKTDGLP